MKNLKYYFNKVKKEKWAIGQFNFSTKEQLKGIVDAAQNLKSPVILGTSEGESQFFGLDEAVALRDVLRKKTGLPIFLNLDHGKNFEYIKQAIDAGYDMVHFDGSKLPLEENIKITKEVKKYAKWKGVLVEGEVGVMGTDASKVYTEKFEIKEENLTKPADASFYAKKTRVELLAVCVGTFHGIDSTGMSPAIRIDRLKEIEEKVKIPFVLHGGSGTPEIDIIEAIKLGICKININTELRIAFKEGLKNSINENQEVAPYKYFGTAIENVKKITEEKIKLFGSENKA